MANGTITLTEMGLGTADLTAIGKLSEKGMTPEQIADAVEKVGQISSSASEIDGSVSYSFAGIRNLRKDGYSHAFGKVSISILGDSHSVGIGTVDFIGYAQKTRDALNLLNNSKNIGIGTKYNFVTTGFTLVENDLALDTISGFYIDIPSGSSIRTYISKNTKVKIIAMPIDAGKTVDLELRKSNLSTIVKTTSTTIGADGISIGELDNNGTDSDMYIKNTSDASIRLTGVYQYVDTSKTTPIIMANGGRKLSGITDRIIDAWFDGAEYAILSLSNNDSDIGLFTNRIDYIISKYNSQTYTKLIILDLNVNDASGDLKRNELIRLNEACKGSIFISIPKNMTKDGSFPDKTELNTLGLLDDDLVHYTKYGHDFIYGCLSKALNISEVPNYSRINSLFNTIDNLMTSGNLISSTWDTTLAKESETSGTVTLRNGYVTINKANNNNPIYQGVTLVSTGFKYTDFSSYNDYEKDSFKLKACSALLTAPTGTTRVTLTTPMSFNALRPPLTKAYYKNSAYVYFSRETTVNFLIPIVGFYYATGKFYIDGIEYISGSRVVSAGWHHFESLNIERTQTHKFHSFLDKMSICRLDISGTNDLEIIITEPYVEVGGELKYIVSRS